MYSSFPWKVLLPVVLLLNSCAALAENHSGLHFDGIEIPSISFRSLQKNDLNVATKLRKGLTSLGIVQISDIPGYADARTKALKNIAECLENDKASTPPPAMMLMGDGSKRLSSAAASHRGTASDFSSPRCGDTSQRLREVVDEGTREVLRTLDRLVAADDANAERGGSDSIDLHVMSPTVKTFDELRSSGEHLEHLHAYYAPSTTTPSANDRTDAGASSSSPTTPTNNAPATTTSRILTNAGAASSSSVNTPLSLLAKTTMDLHTDGGLFIAMTTGYYSLPNNAKIDRHTAGLYIQVPEGYTAFAPISDDSLVFMVGEAGSRWLAPRLGTPLRAVPHAMVAGLLGAAAAGSTRAWYGKMFMPPADAQVPLVSHATGQKMTYAEYRQIEQAVLAKRASEGSAAGLNGDTRVSAATAAGNRVGTNNSVIASDAAVRDLLPVACGRSSLDLVSSVSLHLQSSSSSCTTKDGQQGALCWTQCYPVNAADLGCSATEAICVDTSNHNKPVDGSKMCPGKPMSSACQLSCPVARPSYGPTALPTHVLTYAPTTSSSGAGGGGGGGAPNDDPSNGGNGGDEPSHGGGGEGNGGSDAAAVPGFCYGSGTTMVMDGFVSTILSGPGRTPCINYLFPSWTLDSPVKFVIACVCTVILGVLIGFITKLRFRVSKLPLSRYQLRNTLTVTLFSLNISLGYLAMLVAMTYNVELFIMIVGGLALGHAVFNLDTPPPESTDPCCVGGEVLGDLEGSGHHIDSDTASTTTATARGVLLSGGGGGGVGAVVGFTKRSGYQMLPGSSSSSSTHHQVVGSGTMTTSQRRSSPPSSKPTCCSNGGIDP